MKIVNSILVPTDFSSTSRHALEYAKKLAEMFDAQITVVHVQPFHLSSASEITIPVFSSNFEENVKDAMEEFIAEGGRGGTAVETRLKTKLLHGSAVDVLVGLSNNKTYDLIVMGMTGLEDLATKVFGSVSLEVSKQAGCPVLLIPRDVKWKRVKRVLFAADRPTATHKMVREALNWAHSLDAELHFVHVDEDSNGDFRLSETIWDELFSDDAPAVEFKMKTLYGSDTVEQLKQYAEENRVDCLIFVSRKRSFWQNLTHRSVSHGVAMGIEKPILVIHLDDAPQ